MAASGYLLGIDVGTSSIKAALIDVESGTSAGSSTSPQTEFPIAAPRPGWAEQDPELWWEHTVRAVAGLDADKRRAVAAVGISYQMHGLVALDESDQVVRPSIIWADSRAVPYGEKAFVELGEERCLKRLLNSPGNFTVSKLAWLKDQEPESYTRTAHVMLPGDYIGLRLTGERLTTFSGLSEAIAYDVGSRGPAEFLFDYFDLPTTLFPEARQNFGDHGTVRSAIAADLGIPAGTPVSYRAGDQPNNALSLNVLEPGELAATAGTSGVVYAVVDRPAFDPRSRVNTFVHVNHSDTLDRYGILLCLNGTGILNRWLRENVGGPSLDYQTINEAAAEVPVGCGGLVVLPFGNGAERMLENKNPGASLHGLDLNRHTRKHLLRAAQEGIVFALAHGMNVIREMGIELETVKAGMANMFLSPMFQEAFATTTGVEVELYSTDGAEGAARGAGYGAGIYTDLGQAFAGLQTLQTVRPNKERKDSYAEGFARWRRYAADQL